jgi:hypothetical protein
MSKATVTPLKRLLEHKIAGLQNAEMQQAYRPIKIQIRRILFTEQPYNDADPFLQIVAEHFRLDPERPVMQYESTTAVIPAALPEMHANPLTLRQITDCLKGEFQHR